MAYELNNFSKKGELELTGSPSFVYQLLWVTFVVLC